MKCSITLDEHVDMLSDGSQGAGLELKKFDTVNKLNKRMLYTPATHYKIKEAQLGNRASFVFLTKFVGYKDSSVTNKSWGFVFCSNY